MSKNIRDFFKKLSLSKLPSSSSSDSVSKYFIIISVLSISLQDKTLDIAKGLDLAELTILKLKEIKNADGYARDGLYGPYKPKL